MAKLPKRFLPSGEHKSRSDVTQNYEDALHSLLNYFLDDPASHPDRFLFLTDHEIWEQFEERRVELECTSALALLAAIEAAFQMAYRRSAHKGGPLSMALHRISVGRGGARPSLQRQLLPAWRNHGNLPADVCSRLTKAFEYRHWIAHGRYWVFDKNRRLDFYGVVALADLIKIHVPNLGL